MYTTLQQSLHNATWIHTVHESNTHHQVGSIIQSMLIQSRQNKQDRAHASQVNAHHMTRCIQFTRGLCNCQPSTRDGYGDYTFEHPFLLLNIPKLPDNIFNMLSRVEPRASVEQPGRSYGHIMGLQLCDCIIGQQLIDHQIWIRLGMTAD